MNNGFSLVFEWQQVSLDLQNSYIIWMVYSSILKEKLPIAIIKEVRLHHTQIYNNQLFSVNDTHLFSFSRFSRIVENALAILFITITFMFHNFFSSLARSRELKSSILILYYHYLLSLSLSLEFIIISWVYHYLLSLKSSILILYYHYLLSLSQPNWLGL